MSRSWVWTYFAKISKDSASCSICSKTLTCAGSTTSGMAKHLKSKHNITGDQCKSPRDDVSEPDIDQKPEKSCEKAQNVSFKSGRSSPINRSPAWRGFERLTKEVAKCKICNKLISYKSSTSGMRRHLFLHKPESSGSVDNSLDDTQLNEEQSDNERDRKKEKSATETSIPKSRSHAWKYFQKVSNEQAICTICNKIISYKNSTTGMRRHLSLHEPLPDASTIDETESYSKPAETSSKHSRSWVWRFMEKKSSLTAECKVCQRSVKCNPEDPSGMRKHLNGHNLNQYSALSDTESINNTSTGTSQLRATAPKQQKLLNNCFVCHKQLISLTTKLNHCMLFSDKPLSSLLESLTGAKLHKTQLTNSAVCEDCFTYLEKYDVYQHRCKEIQIKISDLYQQTHTEQVFIKQEQNDSMDEHQEDSNHQTSVSLAPENIFDDSENLQADSKDDSDPDFSDFSESDESSESEQQVSMSTKRKRKMYECDKCDLTTSDQHQFIKHVESHGVQDLGFQCDKCPKVCRSQSNMEVHLIINHGAVENSFDCPICFKQFVTKSSFRCHYNLHDVSKRLLCPICGETFFKKSALKFHLMVHNDERPFACEFKGCQKAFRTKTGRKIHHRVHTGEKLYECQFCPGKRFAQSYGRDLHMKSHHSNLDILSEACKICGVKVQSKAKMKLHLQNVHDVVEAEEGPLKTSLDDSE